MFRKSLIFLFVAAVLVLLMTACKVVEVGEIYENGLPTTSTNSLITDPAVDFYFFDREVSVVFTRSASENNYVFTPEDFPEVNATKIHNNNHPDGIYSRMRAVWDAREELWQVPAEERAAAEGRYRAARRSLEGHTSINIDRYRRFIIIEIEESGIGAILQAISALENRSDVHSATFSYGNGIPD